jgi:hypothetical protein
MLEFVYPSLCHFKIFATGFQKTNDKTSEALCTRTLYKEKIEQWGGDVMNIYIFTYLQT